MIWADADDAQIEEVLERTHALWSDGLDRSAYKAYVRSLKDTPWGRSGAYRFVVLRDPEGRVASAMKLYRFAARAGGRRITVGGVGALYTPPEQRGRGHAARLLELVHEAMAARGDAASLLYSEIGAEYYTRLGYRALDPGAAHLAVPVAAAGAEAPAPGLRRLGPGEAQQAIACRLREAEDAPAAFALEHDEAYRDYLARRMEIPSESLGESRWESRFVVDQRRGQTRGYLWSLLREPTSASAHDGGAAARLLDFGEESPGSSLPALLDDLHRACRTRGIDRVEVWQARDLARRDPRLAAPGALSSVATLPVVPMWRPLDASQASVLEEAFEGAALHLCDVF
jgi:predicted N-acetyltransferase YhbS